MINAKVSVLMAGVVSLAISLLVASVSHAATPPDSCFNFDAGSGTILGYYEHEGNDTGKSVCTKEVDIPAQIGGVDVEIIGAGSFEVASIETLTLPATVTTIGSEAFADNSLTTLILPNTVTSIGQQSFRDNALTSVTLSSSLTAIPNQAFSRNQLTFITIPASVTTIGASAFASNQLSSLVIPGTVTTVSANAFYSNNLSSLTISEGVTSIGSSAFMYNQLTTLVLPNSVLSISGLNTFANNQLTSVSFGNALTGIGQGAFEFNQLASVVVPDTVLSISRHAFAHQTPGMNSDTAYTLATSSDPADWAQVREQIVYTRVYTASPANPNGLISRASLDQSSALYPGNTPAFITGGHLINPASLTVSYVDEDGQPLLGSEFLTGQLSNGDFLNNYYLLGGPAITDTGDEAAIAEVLSAYYHIGDVVAVQPAEVDGYDTPEATPFTLTGAANQQSIVYAATGDTEAGATSGNGVGAPNTGLAPQSLIAVILSAVAGLGVLLLSLKKLRQQR